MVKVEATVARVGPEQPSNCNRILVCGQTVLHVHNSGWYMCTVHSDVYVAFDSFVYSRTSSAQD